MAKNLTHTVDETHAEAIANSMTHALGIILSITALIVMTFYSSMQHSTIKIVASVLYGSTLIAMYSASTFYHLFRNPRVKHYLRIMDHSTIYLLIAGTYTPITLISLHGPWGWSLFGVVWSIALFGIIFKFFFVHRFEIISTILYLFMGWLAIIAIEPIMKALPGAALAWIIAGGLAYSIGVIFYLWKKLLFSHTIWHLFVLAGSACHFFAILFYVIL